MKNKKNCKLILGRVNHYTTAGQMLRTDHIDRGTQRIVMDALGLPVITTDAKGARTLTSYDNLQRPTRVRARDAAAEATTLRQILRYGDSDGLTNPQAQNLKGQLYVHNDEAGKLVYTEYDFKGNNLNFYRQIINDNAVTAYQKYVVNWDNFPSSHLSNTQNTTTQEYDALNRIRKAYYPKDRANQRKIMEPTYNKGGALQAVKVGATDYVSEIAYNARGQRILMAMGNGMMTRYTYNTETFRLSRTKSEKFTKSGHTYTANGGTQQDLAYLYDLEGTILEQNDLAPANTSAQGPGSLKRQFAHDPLRRLISATGRESSNVYTQPSWDLNIRPEDYTATNNYTRTYSYDKLGNIQELDHKATGHSNQDFVRNYVYSGDFNNNQLKQFTYGSNTYSYLHDAAGNVIQESSNRYFEWTHNDKPATFSNQAGTSDPTVYTNYFYNAAGERVKKLVKKGQQLEVTFYMDGGLFETSYVKPTGGSIDNNRFYNTLHVLDGNSRISTIRVGTDADDSTPAIKYYLEDHLMDSLVVLKSDGSLINREEFYPFGETSFGGYGKKRYRFNGKEKDEESGLYNYGQRYYAPWLCRFVSVDPIAEKFADLSSYNYAGNMPVSKVDIDGLQQEGREGTPKSKSVTDGAGNSVNIDPGAKLVEGDTAIISQEGDKFVNVNGVGLVKESHLTAQNIIPENLNTKDNVSDGNGTLRSWFAGLFDWVPDFTGSGDKSGVVSSGLTHVNDDATEINNAGIEGNEVSGNIEINELQAILRRAPGPLKFDGYNNLIDALSSGTELIKEITDEAEPDYDYPLPKKEENKDNATQSPINNEAKTVSGSALENFSKDSLLYGKGKNEYGSHTYGYYHPDKDSLVLNQNGTGFIKIQKNNH